MCSTKNENKLNPYTKYRPSGLPWLGDIPEHWEVRRNGRLFAQRNQTGFSDLPILEVSLKTGVRVRDFDNSKRKQVMTDRDKYKRAVQGDIAYNMMRMWQGAVGMAPVDGLVSPAYVVAQPFPGTDSRYFSYLFRTGAYKNEVNQYSRGIVSDRNRLYWDEFKQMPSAYPPPEEQQLIVHFLNWKAAQINRFVHNKRRLIELLKKQKLRIIKKAVTRGLNPTVKFKPSGVKWIEDIPEHWHVFRLKFLARIKNGQDYKEVEAESGYPVMGSGGQFGYASEYMYEGESVLFGRKGTIDKPLYIKGRFWTVDTMFYTELSEDVFAQFLYNSALSFPFDFYSTKTALPSMTQQDLGNHPIALPPMEEQKDIVHHIDDESRLLDAAISGAQQEIELICEYHTRLISDVVTGRIDVRGIDIHEVTGEEHLVLNEDDNETDEVIDDEVDLHEAH